MNISVKYFLFNTKYGKGKGKLLPKIEEISGEKVHVNVYFKNYKTPLKMFYKK